MRRLSRSRLLWMIAKVLLLLAAVDWVVARVFFPGYIAHHYVWPFLLLQDRTNGANPGLLFEVVRRLPGNALQVVFIGDSTMSPEFVPGREKIAYLAGSGAQKRVRDAKVRPVDAGHAGLFAADGLLQLTKAVGAGADVVVYGFTLRAFPRDANAEWVSRIGDELGPGDLWRIVQVGGLPWLRVKLEPEQVLEGAVYSGWKTYAYRTEIRRYLWENLFRPWLPWSEVLRQPPASGRGTAIGSVPSLPSPAGGEAMGEGMATGSPRGNHFRWTRDAYDYPNQNWEALELIGRLCQRYLPGRCVMYAGPVNPQRLGALTDPGLYQEYLSRLRETAERHRVIWRDYTNALPPADFVMKKYFGRDSIHLNAKGRAALAARLVAPVAGAVAEAERVRAAAGRGGSANR